MAIIVNFIHAISGTNARSIASASSTRSSQTKKSSVTSKRRSESQKGYKECFCRIYFNRNKTIWKNVFILRSVVDESTPSTRRERPSRVKTRDEIYALYCTFGEKRHPGQDFLSKILNILRDSTEGLLTHAEVLKYIQIFIKTYLI